MTATSPPSASAIRDSVLIWGAGSQARLLAAMAEDIAHVRVAALVDASRTQPPEWSDVPLVCTADGVRDYARTCRYAVVAIGADYGLARHSISAALRDLGFEALTLVDPSAIIARGTELGAGCVVMPGVIVNRFAGIGDDVVLNTGASIDHEGRIGDGVHIMGAAALAGRVEVGAFSSIGTNATVLPDILIGAHAYVGAGAVVTRDVADHQVVAGVPAKPLRLREARVSDPLLDALRS